jgi:hypothetical protein
MVHKMISIEKLYQLYLNFPDVCTDTRKITKDCFFVALKGGNFDGNAFANEALNSGAALALVDDPSVCADHRFILIEDALKALQDLASYHRRKLNIPVIAIVGSNGKTTSYSKHYKNNMTELAEWMRLNLYQSDDEKINNEVISGIITIQEDISALKRIKNHIIIGKILKAWRKFVNNDFPI